MKRFLINGLLIGSLTGVALAGETRGADGNSEVVKNFYNMVFVEHKTVEAAEKYLAPSYIQHNPHVQTGRKAFVDFFVPYFKKNPTARSDIKRVVSQGDLVVLHVHGTKTSADRGVAVVDIFRVLNGKIVEHWDVIQAIPEKSANDNGMF